MEVVEERRLIHLIFLALALHSMTTSRISHQLSVIMSRNQPQASGFVVSPSGCYHRGEKVAAGLEIFSTITEKMVGEKYHRIRPEIIPIRAWGNVIQ